MDLPPSHDRRRGRRHASVKFERRPHRLKHGREEFVSRACKPRSRKTLRVEISGWRIQHKGARAARQAFRLKRVLPAAALQGVTSSRSFDGEKPGCPGFISMNEKARRSWCAPSQKIDALQQGFAALPIRRNFLRNSVSNLVGVVEGKYTTRDDSPAPR